MFHRSNRERKSHFSGIRTEPINPRVPCTKYLYIIDKDRHSANSSHETSISITGVNSLFILFRLERKSNKKEKAKRICFIDQIVIESYTSLG